MSYRENRSSIQKILLVLTGLKINCLKYFVNNGQIKYRMFQSCVLIQNLRVIMVKILMYVLYIIVDID